MRRYGELKTGSRRAVQEAIDAYFDAVAREERSPTMEGLAVALGLERMRLLGYSNRDRYAGPVLAARARVRGFWEAKLAERGSSGGAKFWLEHNGGYAEGPWQGAAGDDGFDDDYGDGE